MSGSKDGNLLSFRVIITRSGALMTEYGGIKREDIYKVFNVPESLYIEKVFDVVQPKFDRLHQEIQETLHEEQEL
jgi:hypothetical protein